MEDRNRKGPQRHDEPATQNNMQSSLTSSPSSSPSRFRSSLRPSFHRASSLPALSDDSGTRTSPFQSFRSRQKRDKPVLYHVKQTVIDYSTSPTGAFQNTKICGSYATLTAAQDAAHASLGRDDFGTHFFDLWAENFGQRYWRHGKDVIVWAQAQTGEVFKVTVEASSMPTSSALLLLKQQRPGKGKDDEDQVANGSNWWYMLQRVTDFGSDPDGGAQTTAVLGIFSSREEAKEGLREIVRTGEQKGSIRESEKEQERGDHRALVHSVIMGKRRITTCILPENCWD